MAGQQLLSKLNSLDDDTLTSVLSKVLQDRPEIAPSVVDNICPDLTYAPTRALTDRRCNGVVKALNKQTGIASINCPEMQEIFGSDVKVHMNRIGQFKEGDGVSFALALDKESEPWGFDLSSAGASAGGGFDMGAMMSAMSGGKDASPMDMMAAMSKGMSGGSDTSAMNPMMAMMQAMQKPAPAEKSPMDMMAAMNPMMAMMQAMQKPASGGMDPMQMMMGMMAMSAMNPAASNPAAANPAAAMNPMMAMMSGGVPTQTGPPECHFYSKSGWCKYGDQCILRHVGPARPPPDHQKLGEYMGVIKSYNPDKGFGFIACDALKEEHKGDVFLSQKHVGEFQAGSEVKFTAYLVDGKLQGRELQDASGQVGPQSSAGSKVGQGDEEIGDFVGTIKSYNGDKGFGFIVSPVLKSQGYDADVFLPPDTIGKFSVGNTVAFTAYKRDGRLRARDLTDASGTPDPMVREHQKVIMPPGVGGPPKVVMPPGFPDMSNLFPGSGPGTEPGSDLGGAPGSAPAAEP